MGVMLAGGVEIPQIGFGTLQMRPDETQAAVEEALALGYRHVDTAAAYMNEAGGRSGARGNGACGRGLCDDQAADLRAGVRFHAVRL